MVYLYVYVYNDFVHKGRQMIVLDRCTTMMPISPIKEYNNRRATPCLADLERKVRTPHPRRFIT